MSQRVRHFPAARGQLAHHLTVQPHIHARGILWIAAVAELVRERLAILETRIEVHQLHQIDDGALPVQLLAAGGGLLIEHRLDVNVWARRSARGCRARAWLGGWLAGLRARRRGLRRSLSLTRCSLTGRGRSRLQVRTQDRVLPSVKDAHRISSREFAHKPAWQDTLPPDSCHPVMVTALVLVERLYL